MSSTYFQMKLLKDDTCTCMYMHAALINGIPQCLQLPILGFLFPNLPQMLFVSLPASVATLCL